VPTLGLVFAADPRFDEIDAMDGTAFELAIVDLLQVLGYDNVERIGGFEKGADILATEEGERIAVQVKRHSTAVGIGAVRQLIDGMKRYGCSRGLVITNSFFTEPAIECAQA
jgi:restriction system protein